MPTAQARHVLQHLRQTILPGDDADDAQLLESFLNRRDEMAFAILLRRHGPMVWGVCRRIAVQIPDAEDAFQAVFLILVRNAERIWPRDRIGAWLHGVAFRTARKARQLADHRRAHERQLAAIPHPTVEAILPNGDLNPILDEELSRLPEKFRVPVLLCDLEGRPQRDVARELQVPGGTLCHRLASARRVLARRLTRRGVTLAVGAASAVALPRSLAAVTRRASLALAAGRELASLVPPQIVALTEGVTLMTSSKFRLTAVLVFLFVLGGLGLGARHLPALAAGENDSPQTRSSRPPSDAQTDDRTFLRRLSLDLRGVLPTEVEMNYFVGDRDPAKRAKVATWMLSQVDLSSGQIYIGPIPHRSSETAVYQKLIDEWVRKVSSDSDESKQKNKVSDTQTALEGYLRALKAADQPHTAGVDDAKWNESLKNLIERFYRLQELKRSSNDQSAPMPRTKAPDQTADAYRKSVTEYYKLLEQHAKDADDAKHDKVRLAELQKLFESVDKGMTPLAEIPYLKDVFKKVQADNPLDENKAKQVVEELQRLLDSKQKQLQNWVDPDRQKKLLEELQRAIESLHQKPTKPADSPDSRRIDEQIRRGLDFLIEQEMQQQQKTARLRLAGDLTKGSDPEYLRRIMLDLTGKLPTMVELNYFLADADANKRTKVVDWLVKSSPEAAKRWAEQQTAEKRRVYDSKRTRAGSTPAHFERLLDELLRGSRSDEQILEALTLATLARFPTESERLFLTGFLKSQPDRRNAWEQIVTIQINSDEFRQHLESLTHRTTSK